MTLNKFTRKQERTGKDIEKHPIFVRTLGVCFVGTCYAICCSDLPVPPGTVGETPGQRLSMHPTGSPVLPTRPIKPHSVMSELHDGKLESDLVSGG